WRKRQQSEIHVDIRKQLRRWRRNGVKVTQSRIKALASMLEDDCHIADRDVIEMADERKKFIPLKNGLFNLDSMALEPNRKDMWFTSQLDFEYEPSATCGTFQRFLDSSIVLPSE